MWIEVKEPHNETVEFEFEPVNGSSNAFSHSFVAGGQDDNKRFWKPMNESGNNYTMIVGYANRRSSFATPDANVTAADDDDNVNNFRSDARLSLLTSTFLMKEKKMMTMRMTKMIRVMTKMNNKIIIENAYISNIF